MTEFFRGCVHEKVAELRIPARAAGLEKILHGHADLALHATNRLLKRSCKQRVRCLHSHWVLQLVVGINI